MDVLLIGAGAVGRVFALHLQRGGARVSFFVREKYAEATRRGVTLRALHGKKPPSLLAPDGVLTSMAEVAARRWDAVFLCVSSPALHQGRWLDDLAAAIGDATVVAIQPGLDDPALVRGKVAPARLVWGMFPLLSYEGAAIGETGDHTSYWLPPLTKLPFSGERARSIVEALKAGGLPSRVHPDVPRELPFGSAALNLHMIALECAGWRFAALRADRALVAEMHGALQEALAVSARHIERKVPWALRQLRPWATRLALRLAPRLVPLDIEAYFRVHFTKVGEQSSESLHRYVTRAGELGLPAGALGHMEARLAERRAAAPAA